MFTCIVRHFASCVSEQIRSKRFIFGQDFAFYNVNFYLYDLVCDRFIPTLDPIWIILQNLASFAFFDQRQMPCITV